MTKSIVRLLLLVGLLMVTRVATAGSQDFTVANQTGVEIHALFISPSKADSWGDDILGEDTLANGQSVDIHFPRSERSKI
jgi:hypothetical protein